MPEKFENNEIRGAETANSFIRFLERHYITTTILSVLALFVFGYVACDVVRNLIPDPVYQSSVIPDDCAMCGTGNYFRGENTVAFVTTHDWDILDLSMKRYCGGLEPERLEYRCDLYCEEDDTLTEEGLAHKYAPLNINGVLKEEYSEGINWHNSYATIKSPDENSGTTGSITIRSGHQIVDGVLKLDYRLLKQNEDREKLSTILCPACYEKVLSVTENIDCFLLDCETLDVYTLYQPDWYFRIGDYQFEILFRNDYTLGFLALYEP